MMTFASERSNISQKASDWCENTPKIQPVPKITDENFGLSVLGPLSVSV